MDVSKRYLLVMLSALCGCTPTARLTNLTPQAPIPEDSVRIVQAVESPDSARKIADFRIRPIRMRGTARRAERDITRPLRRAAARNGAELAVVRTCSTRRFLWGRSHTAAGTLLTLRDCDAPYYAADSILPRYYSEGERKRDIRYRHTMEAQRKRDENLRADRRAPAHAFTLAAGYLSGWTSLDVTGIPWHRNNHRSWSLETAYTYTNAIYRISFGVRYIYGYDDYAHTAKIYDQYATYWQCRIFSTGGCNHMHYIAPEIGAAQRFARKKLLLRERIGMGIGFLRSGEYHDAGFGLHANAELEYRITKRIGLRLGVTAIAVRKGEDFLESFDDNQIYLTQMLSADGGFKQLRFGGRNYTLGLNIDL